MNFKNFILSCFITLIIFGCAGWEKNVEKNGIYFKKLRIPESGLISGYLAEDTEIQGFPCKKGYIWFYENWDIEEVRLCAPYEFNNLIIPEGTWIRLYRSENINVCFFLYDVEVEGYVCRGGSMQREGVMITFHENGRLKCFFPREDTIVDGILCSLSLFHGINLHDNGRLKSCKLAEDTIINGEKYKEKTKMKFDSDGNITIPKLENFAN